MGDRISKDQIRRIQTIRKLYGISDETYAEMKKSVGVSSTRDLTWRQYEELERRITGQETKRPHASAKKSGMHREPPGDRKKLLSKVGALLADMKLPWSYADGIAKQMHKVDLVRWCTANQLRGVVTALVKRRKKADAQ